MKKLMLTITLLSFLGGCSLFMVEQKKNNPVPRDCEKVVAAMIVDMAVVVMAAFTALNTEDDVTQATQIGIGYVFGASAAAGVIEVAQCKE